jgi:hypothetical protein
VLLRGEVVGVDNRILAVRRVPVRRLSDLAGTYLICGSGLRLGLAELLTHMGSD